MKNVFQNYIEESIPITSQVPHKQINRFQEETLVFILSLFILMDDGEQA